MHPTAVETGNSAMLVRQPEHAPMDDSLRVALLGGISIQRKGVELTQNLFTKGQALFCYLMLTRTHHPRRTIAGLFWGNKDTDKNALSNLRVNLTRLRAPLADYLITNRQIIAFDATEPYWLDVELFERLVHEAHRPDGSLDVDKLISAESLYHGPFMAGIDMPDAPEFEEWVLRQRARYETLIHQILSDLITAHIDKKEYQTGITYAQRLLALEPWREEAHRQLMWLLELDGQHAAALTQYDQCREILQRELGVDPAPETVQLYEEIKARRRTDRSSTLPPLPDQADEAIPFLAPDPIAAFTGREQERQTLIDHLSAETPHRTVALIGMGGIGKSALAIQVAHDLRDRFPDGVLWANAATSDPNVIAEEWGAAYGYDFSSLPSLEARGAALRGLLAEKEALLIFDDVTSAARIRPLLPDDGRCGVLLTSRNGQFARTLRAKPILIDSLDPEDGVALLINLIGEDRASAEMEAVFAICRLLHNLPLALTLAGRHLALRSRRPIDDYVHRLRDERQRLAALKLEDEEVRLSFAISWQGLDDTQKRIFALLGVFSGRDFDASAMATVTGLNRYVVQDKLDDLVLLSMLTAETSTRYRQHPLLADYAREQLGRDDAAYLRMSQHYLHHANQYREDYTALRPEWENLSAGIEYAHRLHQWADVRAYTDALRTAWFARGRFSEARDGYSRAREAAMALEDEPGLAETNLAAAQACIEQGDYDEAEELLQQAAELFDQNEAPGGVALCYFQMAQIANNRADFSAALDYLEQCAAKNEQADDADIALKILTLQAWVARQKGDGVQAIELAQAALTLMGDEPDLLVIEMVRLMADSHLSLYSSAKTSAEAATHLQAANEQAQRALTLSQETGLLGELAATYLVLARCYHAQKKLEEAAEVAEESLALRQRVGDQRGQALVLYKLTQLKLEMHDLPDALDHAQRIVTISERLNDRLGLAYGLLQLGDCYNLSNELDQAQATWQKALNVAEDVDRPDLQRLLQQRLAS